MKKLFSIPTLLTICFVLGSVAVKAGVPGIARDPRDTAACIGSRVKFITADTGTLPLSVHWEISLDGSTWTPLRDTLGFSRTHTDTLLITTDSLLRGHSWYRAVVTNGTGSDTSLSAMLTVDTLPVAGSIIGASRICRGSSATLTNTAIGGVWSRMYPAIDTITSAGVVTGRIFGGDTIKYTVTNTCGVAVATHPLRVDTVVGAAPIVGPTTTCIGRSITLTNANVEGLRTWSASNANATVSSAGIVTGVAAGGVTISYVFTNGCVSDTSTYSVTVDAPITPGTIAGPRNVCEGSWIHLTPSVSGGIWFSGSTGVAIVDGSGNVTGVSQGTAIISYFLSNACGSFVTTDTITVSAGAAAISGLDSVGIGNTRTYGNSTIGGTWSISDTNYAYIDATTGTVTGRDTGVVTLTYSVTNACGTTHSTMLIKVGPAPIVPAITSTGFDSVCVGANKTLNNSQPGGVWRSSADTLATVSAAGVVTGVANGRDTIFYSYTNGFGTTTVYKVINVHSKPVVSVTGPNSVALSGNYFFRGVPAKGVFTHSNIPMGLIVSVFDSGLTASPAVTFGSYVVMGFGVDNIYYTVTNTCGSTTDTATISLIQPNGIATTNVNNKNMTVVPNPSNGTFSINLEADATVNAFVTITNVVGEKVKELNITTNKATEVKLDQPAGIYFINARTINGDFSAKISIAK